MAKKNKYTSRIARLFACRSLKQVIALLRREKVTGKRGSSLSCPIARYVNKRRRNKDATVNNRSITMGDTVILMPRGCRSFVSQFDDEKLPEFVA